MPSIKLRKNETFYIRDNWFEKAVNGKVLVSNLISPYIKEPYGIRLGIMPVILAHCINELSDNIVFYQKNTEIDLIASNLVKAVNSDHEYYFRSAKGSSSQTQYLNDMLKLLKDTPTHNFRIDTKKLCNDYRKFFVGLPSIIRDATASNAL